MNENMDRIHEVVLAALRDDFDDIEIHELIINRDVDYDDDEVLRITVVFEGTPKNIDARIVSGAVRHVRPKLTAMGENAFPLFSFVSKSDVGARAGEPA